MLVKTVREHANRHGTVKEDDSHRVKKVDSTYDHPEPRTLLESGFVVDAAAADAKQTSKSKPATNA